MIDANRRNHHDDENEVEFFSWQQYRKERRQSEKVIRRKTKRKSDTAARKSVMMEKIPSTINVVCSSMLDESDRTATTVATTMTDHDSSVSTLLFLPEEDINDNSGTKTHGDATVDIIQQQEQQLMDDNVLDHIVLATSSDIDTAVMEFYKLTGVKPIMTGYFNGMGISKARVAFATWEEDGSTSCSSFLEIIAPDPDREGPIGTLLKESASSSSLVPFHWAIRNSTAESLVPKTTKMGYTPDFLNMKGPDQDGIIKKWETLFLYNHGDSDGICPPFFINWDAYDHPCKSLPVVGELNSIRVRYPKNDKAHQLLAHTGSTGFTLEEGSPYFEVQFESLKGPIRFATDTMPGFKIPGFDDATKNKQKKTGEKQVEAAKKDGKDEDQKEEAQKARPAKRVSTDGKPNKETGKSKRLIQGKSKQGSKPLPKDNRKENIPGSTKQQDLPATTAGPTAAKSKNKELTAPTLCLS